MADLFCVDSNNTPCVLGDVDGDRKADAVEFDRSTGSAWVDTSTGAGFSEPEQKWATATRSSTKERTRNRRGVVGGGLNIVDCHGSHECGDPESQQMMAIVAASPRAAVCGPRPP
jgi:hypothetical protein